MAFRTKVSHFSEVFEILEFQDIVVGLLVITRVQHRMGFLFLGYMSCFLDDREFGCSYEQASLKEIQQMSHEKKPSYFPLYWLVDRDPYNGLL